MLILDISWTSQDVFLANIRDYFRDYRPHVYHFWHSYIHVIIDIYMVIYHIHIPYYDIHVYPSYYHILPFIMLFHRRSPWFRPQPLSFGAVRAISSSRPSGWILSHVHHQQVPQGPQLLLRLTDPGVPGDCNQFSEHKVASSNEQVKKNGRSTISTRHMDKTQGYKLIRSKKEMADCKTPPVCSQLWPMNQWM